MNDIARALRYGSVCSGIEAASLAWRPLGLTPAWFAEVDPFANAVLAHHHPHVLNLGDMTRIAPQVLSGSICAPDILVGGTPCQSFSVAGMRKGLADPRGALTLKYVELANAIDQVRASEKKAPALLVWENVPGVLSDRANAFGCFLGAMAGEECEFEPAGKSWANAGCAYGPQRSIAWRVLDAQYFGVAQRRRRVFVVASARTNFDPAAVLFECESLRRDTPPRQEARQDAASAFAQGTANASCGSEDSSEDGRQEAISVCFGGGNASGPIDRAACLTARGHKDDFEVETFAVQALSGEVSHPLTCAYSVTEDGNGRGVPIISMRDTEALAVQTLSGRPVTHALNTANNGKGCSEDGSGRGVPIISVSYRLNESAVAFAQNSRGEVRLEGGAGQVVGALSRGGGKPGQGFPTIASSALRGRDTGSIAERGGDIASALRASDGGANKAHVLAPSFEAHLQCQRDRADGTGWQPWRVRRLMPLECERLQGLPDHYTRVLYRGTPAADGPRYKAIGNSMAVPCVAWIGRRLLQVLGYTSV
ncbi:MAG: DNA cytosine methyltransferase, partial [Gammaproteobacteria bacterium]